ncbi:MAG: hypothetical protein ABW034_01225, partial [Steroidobacteraceae bacterium]
GTGALPIDTDDFFLSRTNPVATRDQRDAEALALRLLQAPEVLAARKVVEFQWRSVAGPNVSAQAWTLFDQMIEEYVFANVLKAVSSDTNHPKAIGNFYGPPHEWFGVQVPGTRLAGDGPDSLYVAIAVDPTAHMEVHGQWLQPKPADFNANLFAAVSFRTTLEILTGQQLQADEQGRFVITLDPEPAGGRQNHIQTRPHAKWLFMRQTRSDWRQVPSTLRVHRREAPYADPIGEAEILRRAVEYMIDDVPNTYWWQAMSLALAPNSTSGPFKTAAVGGLVSQSAGFGRVVLADDEALIINVGHGGAGFRDIVLLNYWYITPDYSRHTSSFTNTQGIDNGDGTTTYVVSLEDPGIHNWLDPAGLHEAHLVFRWQLIPPDSPEGAPFIETRLVKFSELPDRLGRSVKRVTAAERQQQLKDRLAQFQLRFADR